MAGKVSLRGPRVDIELPGKASTRATFNPNLEPSSCGTTADIAPRDGEDYSTTSSFSSGPSCQPAFRRKSFQIFPTSLTATRNKHRRPIGE